MTSTPVILFTFDWVLVLQFVLAVVLPLVVAVVTKRSTPGLVKVGILALLTAVTTVLTAVLGALTTGIPVELFSIILTAVGSILISIATYVGVWDASRGDQESIAKVIQAEVGVR